MMIDGVTVCAGPLYAGYLAKTLPVWLETLDSVVVVRTDDRDKSLATSQYNCITSQMNNEPIQRTVFTDAFTRNGAKFNKGAALNDGLAFAAPSDWILCFDCDILPPSDWREKAEQWIDLSKQGLYSARRWQQDGTRTDGRPYDIRGYFMLWHSSDPHYRRAPVFSEDFNDASGYDTEFASQWFYGKWWELPLPLTHLGERSKHWCGPNSTPEDNAQAVKQALRRRAQRAS